MCVFYHAVNNVRQYNALNSIVATTVHTRRWFSHTNAFYGHALFNAR